MAWLPDQLPKVAKPEWEATLTSPGHGGIVADDEFVLVSSRDLEDRRDLVQCFDAQTGMLLWQHLTEAPGNLDYGNASRATPLIHEGLVYVASAFGDLHCLELDTGVPLWHRHLVRDLGGVMPEWGFAGSPIMVDDQLIVQPGGAKCSIAALDAASGETIWQSPGEAAVYASLMLIETHDDKLVVGLDKQSVVAWNLKSGQVVWRSQRVVGDFGVPSPVLTRDGWLLSSENNGSRWFPLEGKKIPSKQQPAFVNNRASPDSHTPVIVGDRAYVVDDRVYCLDLEHRLATAWKLEDRTFRGYTSLIASDDHLLAFTESGELLLVECERDAGKIVGRLRLANEGVKCLSHPALVGNRLYIRFGRSLWRLDL